MAGVQLLSRLTGKPTGAETAAEASAPPPGGAAPGEGAADPDAAGFQAVADELKGTPKRGRGRPRGSRTRRPGAHRPAGGGAPAAAPDAGERDEQRRRTEASAACDRFLESSIPRLVARLYARGIDIAALVTLAGLRVPANFYERVSVDADAELWAETAIRHSFEVAPETAEKTWRAVAMYGLPLLHVGEAVLAARDRYLEQLTRAARA